VTSSPLDLRVERMLRDLAPQVLGAMVRRYRDFAASEDAVQEALIAARRHPRQPAWLADAGGTAADDRSRSQRGLAPEP